MSQLFYRAFEDRFRGSFELIQARLAVYLPFLHPLNRLSKKPQALDLGCGRGEWLDLLRKQGLSARGIDLDEGMLKECRLHQLDVMQGNAVEYIKSLPENSLDLITAFHFVEHISFSALQEISRQAHRVLKPGGLLIFETPNPESLLVGTASFYLDPTHEKPLPSELLSFVMEYAQFSRVKVLFLQESSCLAQNEEVGLYHMIEGVSPDYAIVAQKKASPSVFALFEEAFSKEHGTRLLPLAKRYDEQMKRQNSQVLRQLETLSQKMQHFSNRLNPLEKPQEENKAWRYEMDLLRKDLEMLQQKIAEMEKVEFKPTLNPIKKHVSLSHFNSKKGKIARLSPLLLRLRIFISAAFMRYPYAKHRLRQVLKRLKLLKYWQRFQSYLTRAESVPGPLCSFQLPESAKGLSLQATRMKHHLKKALKKKG